MPHRAALFERVAEKKIIVVFEPHAAQNDDVHFRLHGDARKQFVVRFARDGKDGELLTFDKGIEHIDHRNARTYHLFGDNSARRIDRRPADGDHVFRECGAVVLGNARTRKDAAEQVIGIGDHHGFAQEFDGVGGADALRPRKDL